MSAVNKFLKATNEQNEAFNNIKKKIDEENNTLENVDDKKSNAKSNDKKSNAKSNDKKTTNKPKKTSTKKDNDNNSSKQKQGRPCIDKSKGKKKNYCKTINIAVPKEDINKIQEYALNARGINLTEYINLLIEQDLKKNLTKYKKEINRDKNFD